MAQQTIGVGAVANDNTGDPIRDAFVKVNANYDELYGSGIVDPVLSNLVTPGLEATPTSANPNGITVSGDNVDFTIKANGTGQIIFDTNTIRISTTRAPTSTGAAGDVAGDITWDTGFVYVCINSFPNGSTVWARAALTTSY